MTDLLFPFDPYSITLLVGSGQQVSSCRGHGCMNCRHRNSGKEKFEVGESSWKNKEIKDDSKDTAQYRRLCIRIQPEPLPRKALTAFVTKQSLTLLDEEQSENKHSGLKAEAG